MHQRHRRERRHTGCNTAIAGSRKRLTGLAQSAHRFRGFSSCMLGHEVSILWQDAQVAPIDVQAEGHAKGTNMSVVEGRTVVHTDSFRKSPQGSPDGAKTPRASVGKRRAPCRNGHVVKSDGITLEPKIGGGKFRAIRSSMRSAWKSGRWSVGIGNSHAAKRLVDSTPKLPVSQNGPLQ